MATVRALLLLVLGAMGVWFSAFTIAFERRHVDRRLRASDPERQAPVWPPRPIELVIGFVTDFFDTLGIGSFAPTTAMFRFWKVVPDRLIPGTMIVGHFLPALTQALIYITVIEVDVLTLVLLLLAAIAGSWLGAALVSRLDRRAVQIGMGTALLLADAVLLVRLRGYLPAGGDLIMLSGFKLAIALAGNFVLGALMNIGIGAFGPSLIFFALLGMNIKAIFPIMMGSCAVIMPAGGRQFVRHGSYAPRAALGLTLAGVPAVLLAAFVVRELPLVVLSYVVLVVVVYTAITMLRAGLRAPAASDPGASSAPPGAASQNRPR
jgi:uncharacterized membrane protein YfcA